MSTVRSRVLATLCWTIGFVILLDVTINVAFRMPRSSQQQPTLLQRYFDYGRTVDGKLDRMLGRDDSDAAPIVTAGWLDRECSRPVETAATGSIGVSVYGMSFSNHVGEALQELDSSFVASLRAGPSASVNHSYACFRKMHDAHRDGNPVQVIGVLASSLNRMRTLTGLTTSFEGPMPYTYPRYRLTAEGGLTEEQPLVQESSQLRDPTARKAFFGQLERSDASFDRWLMRADAGDASALGRLVRRAYAQHAGAVRVSEWSAPTVRSVADDESGAVVLALLRDFATRSRADGALPIVLLIQDRPGKDELFRLLGPGLKDAAIQFVSTHEIVPTTDPANFLSDSHFTPAKDRLVAMKVLELIVRTLRAGPSHNGAARDAAQ